MRRFYVQVRLHDDKYYSRNSMRAIRAGLDTYLNKENINFSVITDRAFKPANGALDAHLVELACEGKISSTKHKPAMTPQNVGILYEKKQLVLPLSSKFNPQRLWTTSFLAPFNVKLLKKALWWKSNIKQSVALFSTAGSAWTSSLLVFGWSIPQSYFQYNVLLQLNTR